MFKKYGYIYMIFPNFATQENLAKLQRMFSRKWEFIFMQAEAQAK